jgi:signal transduction histidine kinase
VPPELARELHDTALATLAAIAGGRLDHSSEQVRRRAAQDVARIRGMLAGTPAERRTSLHDSLREVTSSAELLGLTVHRVGSGACGDLPPPAVSALTAAAREALNNVAAHAGTAECWLTMIPAGAGVTVRVVDRGCGFELGSFSPGYGLRHSVLERMDRCGGTVRLSSAPAAGTCVDLIWPK